MKPTTVTNPRYIDAAHTVIEIDVTWDTIGGPFPFTSSAADLEPHAVTLRAALLAGSYGPIAPYMPDFARLAAEKKTAITRARDVACATNVTALGHTWQADTRSYTLLVQAITLAHAGLPLPPVWRTADNVDVPIVSLADLLAIAGAVATQVQAAYSKSWMLKGKVDVAVSANDVAAISAVIW